MYTQVRRRKGREEGLGALQSQPFPDPAPTFKVHSSISIEVHIADNLLDVSVSHLMTQQLPHGLSQLTGAYLPITIGVELESEGGTGTAGMGNDLKAEQCPLGQGSFSNQVPSRDPELSHSGTGTRPAHPCLSAAVTHLPKGISQFLYTNHICCLCQEFRSH